ncbi:MAG: Serine/threonine-protein kinase plk1, partial [Paramarteilia canceri]
MLSYPKVFPTNIFKFEKVYHHSLSYTLLVGKAPFETKTLKDTYKRIQTAEYVLPSTVSSAAKQLIGTIFQNNPTRRPSVPDLLVSQFFEAGFHPQSLPESCLTTEPQLNNILAYSQQLRRPLNENSSSQQNIVNNNNREAPNYSRSQSQFIRGPNDRLLKHMDELICQISAVLESNTGELNNIMDDAEDPASVPIYWISKWVDYSEKYGFGFQLCDNSNGALFNDSSQLILFSNG